MKKAFLAVFFVFLFLSSAKPSYASICVPTFTFKGELVVAKLVSFTHSCNVTSDGHKSGYYDIHFNNLKNVIGSAPQNFIIRTYDDNKCLFNQETDSNKIDFYRIFGGLATVLQKDDIYLMSLSKDKAGNFQIGGCGSIIKNVSSANDPLVNKTKFTIVKNDIILSGFAAAVFVSEKTGIGGILVLVLAFLYYILATLIVVKLLLYIIRRIRKH